MIKLMSQILKNSDEKEGFLRCVTGAFFCGVAEWDWKLRSDFQVWYRLTHTQRMNNSYWYSNGTGSKKE